MVQLGSGLLSLGWNEGRCPHIAHDGSSQHGDTQCPLAVIGYMRVAVTSWFEVGQGPLVEVRLKGSPDGLRLTWVTVTSWSEVEVVSGTPRGKREEIWGSFPLA